MELDVAKKCDPCIGDTPTPIFLGDKALAESAEPQNTRRGGCGEGAVRNPLGTGNMRKRWRMEVSAQVVLRLVHLCRCLEDSSIAAALASERSRRPAVTRNEQICNGCVTDM